MSPDAAPQVTATAVVLGAQGPLGAACTAELGRVLGAEVAVTAVDAQASPGDVIGSGSPGAPLRWFVAIGVEGAVLAVVVPPIAESIAHNGGGRVVVVAPSSGHGGSLSDAARRGAEHGAVVGLARAVARQVADRGVTVNVVRPGVLATGDLSVDGEREAEAKGTPIRRLVTSLEVAAAVGHLVSPDAGYVNGIVLPVDGGAAMARGT